MTRPAGTPNIIPGDVKTSIMSVYKALGSADELLRWAKKNQTEYYKMLVAILPKEQKIEFVNPLMTVTASDIARLVESLGRSRGFAIPASVDRIIEAEARVVPAIHETKRIP